MTKKEAVNVLLDNLLEFIPINILLEDEVYEKERKAIKVLTGKEAKEFFN